MIRPSKELITSPGIRYLEFYGLRFVRNFLFLKIMIILIGLMPIIATIVIYSLHIMDDFPPFYYILGGMGGVLLLIAFILLFILPNRRTYNKILALRNQQAIAELKEILYKPGAKSTLAMLALIDLGEVNPNDFYRMRGYEHNQQSLGGL